MDERVKPQRIVAVDVFRGLTIAAMILVNNPGSWVSTYPPLRHASWHGWTPTDLVFASWLPDHGASLAYALTWIAGWYAVLWLMYRRGWIIKV